MDTISGSCTYAAVAHRREVSPSATRRRSSSQASSSSAVSHRSSSASGHRHDAWTSGHLRWSPSPDTQSARYRSASTSDEYSHHRSCRSSPDEELSRRPVPRVRSALRPLTNRRPTHTRKNEVKHLHCHAVTVMTAVSHLLPNSDSSNEDTARPTLSRRRQTTSSSEDRPGSSRSSVSTLPSTPQSRQ